MNQDENYNVETTYEEPQVEVAKPRQRAKKFKLLWPLIGIGVVLAAVAVALTIYFSSPWVLIQSGIKNSTKAFQKNEVISLLTDVNNGGSVELVLDMDQLFEALEYPQEDALSGTLSAKYYADRSKSSMVMTVDYKDGSEDIVDAQFFLDKDNIAIRSQALLDGDAYGISLKTFAQNLKKSEFGPDGEYYLGDDLFEFLENIDLEQWEDLDQDRQKLAESIYKEIFKSLKNNSTVEKFDETISFAGEDTKVTAVNIQMDDAQMVNFLKDMLDYLRNDKQLREYLNEHYETLIFSSPDMDADEVIDYFYDSLDDFDDLLEEIEEELEDASAKLDLTVYITKKTRQAVGFELRLRADGETSTKITFLAGPDLENAKEISLKIGDEEIVYEVTTSNAKDYEATLTILDASEMTISYDKKNGDFTIRLKQYGDTIAKISGTIQKEKKSVTLTLDSVTIDRETTKIKGVSIIWRNNDKMPATPAYTEILKMDADDIEDVIEDIMAAVQELS